MLYGEQKQREEFQNFIEQDHLYNYDNYWVYKDLVQNGIIDIDTGEISKENLDTHFFSIINILKDGIETDKVHNMKINVHFTDNETVKLSIFYYFYNLIMWGIPLECGDSLTSEFLFFPKDLTAASIKDYIDSKMIEKHHSDLDIRRLNNIIDNSIYKFKYVDEFHLYLLNTINNEDTIDLMNSNKDFYDCIHADLSNVPIEDIKNTGMDIENRAIEIMKNSDHCLRDAFRTKEGINPRQHKEFTVNIGVKPDGNGGVYSHSINSSFSNGGLQSEDDLIVESGASRVAQILGKENVGDSGYFSRTLGLNNQSSRLYDDPEYVCNTRNLMKVNIKNAKILSMYKNRWFRYKPDGIEHKISMSPIRDNKDLIGKTVYFRSPMTCASSTRGKGICYRCYGDLAHVNYTLSIGKIAAELLCSILTQMLLSSKHLLESKIMSLKWVKEFYNYMSVEINMIVIKDTLLDLENYKLEIYNIEYDNEYDNFDYNAHVSEFNIILPDGDRVNIKTENGDSMYLSNALLEMINSTNTSSEEDAYNYIFSFKDLKDIGIFMIKLVNAEISRTLERLTSTIKTSSGIKGKTKEYALETIIDTIIEGGINIDAVHLETLLSNQMRASAQDILEMPMWESPDAEYYMIGLNQALTDNPSVTVSLEFEKTSKALYYPLNYRKKKANSVDLFFMTQPQNLMSVEEYDPDKPKTLFTHIKPKSEVK